MSKWQKRSHLITLVRTLALDIRLSIDFLFFETTGVVEVGVLEGDDAVGVFSPPSSALPFLGGW